MIMTTHGRSGLARLWLGSTADALIHHSHSPILLLRPDDGWLREDEAQPMRRIAIALDGSHLGEQILEPALAFGRIFDADYTLIRVVDVVVAGGIPDMVRPLELEHDMLHRRVQAAERYLDDIAQRLRLEGARVRTRVLVELQPAQAILREIHTQHYDLVALATHGRSGLRRLLTGSVTDKILHGITIPALVCHPRTCEHPRLRVATTAISVGQM